MPEEPIHIKLGLTHPEYAFIKTLLADRIIRDYQVGTDMSSCIDTSEGILRKLGDGDTEFKWFKDVAKRIIDRSKT